EIYFSGAEEWSPEQRRGYRKLVQELAERIEQIGLPNHHPWRGACRETVLALDVDPLLKRVSSLITALDQVSETSINLASALSQPVPSTFLEFEHQKIIADYVAQAPALDKHALRGVVWNAEIERLREIVTNG